MKIIGCDLHSRQQTLAMLDTTTGEVVKATLKHEVRPWREPRVVRHVRIAATTSKQIKVSLLSFAPQSSSLALVGEFSRLFQFPVGFCQVL